MYSLPQVSMLSKTGWKLFPISVKEYSTRGGTSGKTSRCTSPSSTNNFKWLDKVECVMSISRRSSLNFFAPNDSSCKIKIVHFPASKTWLVTNGHFPKRFLLKKSIFFTCSPPIFKQKISAFVKNRSCVILSIDYNSRK